MSTSGSSKRGNIAIDLQSTQSLDRKDQNWENCFDLEIRSSNLKPKTIFEKEHEKLEKKLEILVNLSLPCDESCSLVNHHPI